jgi:2-polyprenyl-3-methyl-5-hydroxy-6-metoxy-1,4-benzoquinol methylase
MNVQTVKHLVRKALRSVIPEELRARIKPYQAEVYLSKHWDAEYASGRWNYLGQFGELAHYSVMAAYCAFFKPQSAILDVGCGTGILMHRLRTVGYASYLGFDISEKAIEQARINQNETTRFEVANAETFQPPESYDVIIFNESLYYLPDPRGVLLRYAKHLRSGGIIIVSTYRVTNNLRMWRLLDGVAPILDAVSLKNDGTRWDIKVYRGRES